MSKIFCVTEKSDESKPRQTTSKSFVRSPFSSPPVVLHLRQDDRAEKDHSHGDKPVATVLGRENHGHAHDATENGIVAV